MSTTVYGHNTLWTKSPSHIRTKSAPWVDIIPIMFLQGWTKSSYLPGQNPLVSCIIILHQNLWIMNFCFYATAASAMRWHIAIHLCAFACMCVCVCLCVYWCVCLCVFFRLYSELKKSSCEKPLVEFQPNLAGLILGWRASKVVQKISFHAEIWLQWQPKKLLE
jgi:hypothetical protein